MDKLRRALSGDDAENRAEQGGALQEIMDASTLSWETRLKWFLICFIGGFLFSILGAVMLFFFNYKAFAVFYTLGSLTSLGSTMFLMGPVKQLKAMFSSTRVIATVIVLLSIALTIFFAVKGKAGLALLFCLIQFLAMIWYSISYIPFARDAVKKCLSGLC